MKVVVKLGGSVITRKDEPFSIRLDTVIRLAGEVSVFRASHQDCGLALVHGGGSFGHPVVEECLKTAGCIDQECFSRTSFYMDLLSHAVAEALLSSRLPAVRIPPRSVCEGVEYESCDLWIVSKMVDAGVIPLLYGDVVLSRDGFRVISGDDIVWYLAKFLGVEKVIFVTDVNGVYDRNPKKFGNARVLSGMHVNEALRIAEFWGVHDVTGGMLSKLRKVLMLDLNNVEIYVINGLIPNNLLNALEGKKVVGSVLWV